MCCNSKYVGMHRKSKDTWNMVVWIKRVVSYKSWNHIKSKHGELSVMNYEQKCHINQIRGSPSLCKSTKWCIPERHTYTITNKTNKTLNCVSNYPI